MKKLFFISLLLLLAASLGAADKERPEVKERTGGGKPVVEEIDRSEEGVIIDDLVPEKNSYISLPLLLTFDFFVPGAGHFYQGNYWLGSSFVVLKATGAWSIYYFYNQWAFYRSLYHAAQKANEGIDPDHQLLFKVPGKGYKTVEQLKRLYDSSAQNITFAVLGNILVYTVSLAINYVYYKKNSRDSIPTFNLALTTQTVENDFCVSLGYTFRL